METGKITYLSDDGNWGLLADGDHVIEIYSGSELDLNATSYPEINSNYVEIKGEVSHYYGNFQLSFIKSIRKYEGTEVTAPTNNFATLTSAQFEAAKLTNQPAEGSSAAKKNQVYRQFTGQFEQNSLATVTGKVLTNPSSSTKGARFTFDLELAEGVKIEVAYDYHVDKNSGNVEAALRAKAVKDSTITLKGTLRFSHGVDKTLIPLTGTAGAGGNWSIVPFEVGHMVA